MINTSFERSNQFQAVNPSLLSPSLPLFPQSGLHSSQGKDESVHRDGDQLQGAWDATCTVISSVAVN